MLNSRGIGLAGSLDHKEAEIPVALVEEPVWNAGWAVEKSASPHFLGLVTDLDLARALKNIEEGFRI